MRPICLLFLILFTSCYNSFHSDSGVSSTIKESKKREVFVCEYVVPQNPFIINDSLKIEVKEAWLEKKWSYGNLKSNTILNNSGGYQLHLIAKKENFEDYDFGWTIGNEFMDCFRSSSDYSILLNANNILPNTLKFKVVKGEVLKDSHNIVIGEFVLIEKKR
jgi:hypothetical protein